MKEKRRPLTIQAVVILLAAMLKFRLILNHSFKETIGGLLVRRESDKEMSRRVTKFHKINLDPFLSHEMVKTRCKPWQRSRGSSLVHNEDQYSKQRSVLRWNGRRIAS